jgi:hypothetical protein
VAEHAVVDAFHQAGPGPHRLARTQAWAPACMASHGLPSGWPFRPAGAPRAVARAQPAGCREQAGLATYGQAAIASHNIGTTLTQAARFQSAAVSRNGTWPAKRHDGAHRPVGPGIGSQAE